MEAALCDSSVCLMRPVFDMRGDFRLAVHDPILKQVYSRCLKPVRLNNCISAINMRHCLPIQRGSSTRYGQDSRPSISTIGHEDRFLQS